MPSIYRYRRENSDGRIYAPDHNFATRRAALQMIGHNIVDNGHGVKRDAQTFTATIVDDVAATFGPYTFTLTKVKVAK